ncbi:hypothetical protein CHS0354_001582 [Potamilus streckersoni]|uniref:SRCR domain-containing protein n=1 Tax=Potamilus streckersoni TaxID=2493646 RepID=A0AAE0T1I2_9BIVA|nr:hypothetical protein CHS0354_001582 [Potamilus streckersoni]
MTYDLLVETVNLKAGLKCITMVYGEQYATMDLTIEMLKSFAICWVMTLAQKLYLKELLGHNFPESIQLYTYNRYGSGTGQIWLNNLSCNGTESRLDECPSITWGTNSCSHSQDIGVDCHQNVRLYGGRYPSEGYVQIGNDWKTICGYNLDGNLARVVCQSLGFNTSFWVPTYYSLTGYVTTSNTSIRCPRGKESNIAECKQGYCSNNYYAPYVNCTVPQQYTSSVSKLYFCSTYIVHGNRNKTDKGQQFSLAYNTIYLVI